MVILSSHCRGIHSLLDEKSASEEATTMIMTLKILKDNTTKIPLMRLMPVLSSAKQSRLLVLLTTIVVSTITAPCIIHLYLLSNASQHFDCSTSSFDDEITMGSMVVYH